MADNTSSIMGGLGGAASGAAIGAQIGTLIPVPGLGTILGALAGGAIGAIGGAKKQKAVDDAMASIEAIPAVDPNMLDFKDQMAREKRAVESGFSTDFQVASDMISQSEAGGLSVSAELAMTNPSLALMMMNQIATQTDVSTNKALGTIATKGMGYTQLLSDLVEKISQREIDVEMMKASYKMGNAQANKKDFNANAMALLAKFGPKALDMIAGMKGSGGGIGGDLSPDQTLVDSPVSTSVDFLNPVT